MIEDQTERLLGPKYEQGVDEVREAGRTALLWPLPADQDAQGYF